MKLLDTLKNHKGTIAALGAVFGAFATAYYAHKDTVEELQEDENTQAMYSCPECPLIDKMKYYSKHYWRTGLALGFTVGNIVISDRTHVKTIAGLAGGIALYAQQNEEIMGAVKEVFGQEGVEKLDKAIIQKHADKLPEYEAEKKHSLPTDGIIIYDPISKTYFKTSKERLFQAEMEINHELHSTWLVPYTYLVKLIGKPIKQDGTNADLIYLGWCLDNDEQNWNWSFTQDNCAWIRFCYDWDDKRGCSVLTYEVGPDICYDDNGPLY